VRLLLLLFWLLLLTSLLQHHPMPVGRLYNTISVDELIEDDLMRVEGVLTKESNSLREQPGVTWLPSASHERLAEEKARSAAQKERAAAARHAAAASPARAGVASPAKQTQSF